MKADNIRRQAVVLIEQGLVVLCNQAARRAGIRPGTSLATANTIAPDLAHIQRCTEHETQRLRTLAETLYQLSPQVSIEPPASVAVEVSGCLRLFGNAHDIAQHAAALSAQLGHYGVARLASTPSAAIALARTKQTRVETVPLHALNLEAASVERFVNMGFQKVGDIINLPAKEIGQRFGAQVLQQLQQLTGQRSDPRPCITLSAEFDQTLELLEPMRSKEGLLFPMQRLANELRHWLISRQLAVGQLQWSFRSAAYRHSGTSAPARDHAAGYAAFTAEFAQPHQDPQKMLQISQLRLEQTLLPEDVLSLSLNATRLLPLTVTATDLFDPRQRLANGAAAYCTPDELLDQLKARLGNRACRTLTAESFHHPSWLARQPVSQGFGAQTAARSQPQNPKKAEHSQPDGGEYPSHRPLWLCSPPRPVDKRELELLHGPERIHTAWWHRGICRDYYIARHHTHRHCWVFTDHSERWFIHGYFG